jgi:hypothetical protein
MRVVTSELRVARDQKESDARLSAGVGHVGVRDLPRGQRRRILVTGGAGFVGCPPTVGRSIERIDVNTRRRARCRLA